MPKSKDEEEVCKNLTFPDKPSSPTFTSITKACFTPVCAVGDGITSYSPEYTATCTTSNNANTTLVYSSSTQSPVTFTSTVMYTVSTQSPVKIHHSNTPTKIHRCNAGVANSYTARDGYTSAACFQWQEILSSSQSTWSNSVRAKLKNVLSLNCAILLDVGTVYLWCFYWLVYFVIVCIKTL